MVTLIANVTHSDATLIYLIDHGTNEIVLRASQLPHDEEIGKSELKMGEGVTGWVASHKSVLALARDASSDARFKPFRSMQEDTYQAFLSLPMIDCGEVIGVINVHHKQPHTHSSDEMALVTFISEQMRGVVTRARLTERSQSAVRRMGTLAAVPRRFRGRATPNGSSRRFPKCSPRPSIPRFARYCSSTLQQKSLQSEQRAAPLRAI